MESGGKLFWAEPLKEIDYLEQAAGLKGLFLRLEDDKFYELVSTLSAGNLVMPLDFEGLIFKETPLESAVTSMEESFVEVIDEGLATWWQEEGARAVKSLEGVSLSCLEQWDIPSLG